MTRNQLIAPSTPWTAGTASIEEMSLRRPIEDRPARRARRRIGRRKLFALPAALALMVPAAPALAQTETSGYSQKPPTPTTTTKTEPKKAVEPSTTTKAPTTPTTAVEPAKTTPTTTTPVAKAATLPFTGLNLTWVLGAGLLLLCAGLAIRLAARGRPGAGH